MSHQRNNDQRKQQHVKNCESNTEINFFFLQLPLILISRSSNTLGAYMYQVSHHLPSHTQLKTSGNLSSRCHLNSQHSAVTQGSSQNKATTGVPQPGLSPGCCKQLLKSLHLSYTQGDSRYFPGHAAIPMHCISRSVQSPPPNHQVLDTPYLCF